MDKYKCLSCGKKFSKIHLTNGLIECPKCKSTFTMNINDKAKMTMATI